MNVVFYVLRWVYYSVLSVTKHQTWKTDVEVAQKNKSFDFLIFKMLLLWKRIKKQIEFEFKRNVSKKCIRTGYFWAIDRWHIELVDHSVRSYFYQCLDTVVNRRELIRYFGELKCWTFTYKKKFNIKYKTFYILIFIN